jgi:phosphatidylethanolamine/phosphatidyl-N-methylethanolamine N-methyltransferase
MAAEEQASAIERDRGYWERHARNYHRSLRVLGTPLPRMLKLTFDAVQDCEQVLEVAAGTGLVTATIAGAARHVIATDYAEAMVAILRDRVQRAALDNVTCERADIYKLQYPSASFDAVVAANVLHLVPDLERALSSLRRVLRPHGRLVVPTFCHDETWLAALASRLVSITGFPGRRRFTLEALCAALEQNGLQVSQREIISGLIPIGYVHGTFVRDACGDSVSPHGHSHDEVTPISSGSLHWNTRAFSPSIA